MESSYGLMSCHILVCISGDVVPGFFLVPLFVELF